MHIDSVDLDTQRKIASFVLDNTTSKQAGGWLDAGRAMFSAGAKAFSKPKVAPIKPTAATTGKIMKNSPNTVKRPAAQTAPKPATAATTGKIMKKPRPVQAAPATAAKPGLLRQAATAPFRAAGRVLSNPIGQIGTMMAAPYAIQAGADWYYGTPTEGQEQMQPTDLPAGYEDFSGFANQNPQYMNQLPSQLQQVLSTPQAMRDYFAQSKMSSMSLQPSIQPDAGISNQQQNDDSFIPEEQLRAAKELLLKDEMNAEMQKWEQQNEKRTMDRLKTDPDGSAVVSHLESQGQPANPRTVREHGSKLHSQYQQALSQGEMRPFNQWVADMSQPMGASGDQFAFDAAVARRKTAALIAALLRTEGQPAKQAGFFDGLMTYTQPGRSLKSVYDAASNGDILGTVGAIGSGIWDNSSTGQTLNNFREGSQLAAGASERYANKFLGDHTDSSRAIGDTMATRHGVSQGVAPYAGGGSPIGMAVGTGITEGANASEGVIAPWRDRILGKANDAVARRTGFNAVDKVFKPFNEVMTGASGWWNGTEKELAKPIVTQQAAPTSPAPASSAPAPTPPTPAPVFQRPTPTNTTTAAQPSKPATGTNVATAAPNTSNLKSRMSKLQNSGNLQNAFVKKTY